MATEVLLSQIAVASSTQEALPAISTPFDDAVRSTKSGNNADQAVKRLLALMSEDERLATLDGDDPFWQGLRGILFDRYNRKPFVMGSNERLGIPGIRFTDGPRGIVMHESTCFPVSVARGATWDIDLERRVGEAIGKEGRAQGANYFAGICINLPRHPAWGRIQETYGEDPVLLGDFGKALHQGVHPYMMTCVKHFALNSMENARFKVDVRVDDAALHEVYLPHFHKLIQGGVTSVMSSYNSVRGEFAGQNHELLNGILREQWGFHGFTLSDFIFGLRDAVTSVKNGLDIEAPFRQQRAQQLRHALDAGELAWSDVDRACFRILRAQVDHAVRTGTARPAASLVFCEGHRALAREAGSRAMVLLKNERVGNEPLLPLEPRNIRRLAVIGRLANIANTGDRGSSAVFAPEVTTIHSGFTTALPDAEVVLDDSDSVTGARKAACDADFVICVVGYDAADEGEYVVPCFQDNPALRDLLPPTSTAEDEEVKSRLEGQSDNDSSPVDGIVPGAGGDRKSLRLRARDVEIIEAARKASPRVMVCVVAAGAFVMEEWVDKTPGLLISWYSGSEGGHSLADVVLGKTDASGRLPFSIPTSEEHLPYFDHDATTIEYDRWFGQRLLDKLDVKARFPLGFGLSYTTFDIETLHLSHPTSGSRSGNDFLAVQVKVTNTGSRSGRHIVQIYGRPGQPNFPTRVLLGFKPVDLESKRSAEIEIMCDVKPLQRWENGCFQSLQGREVEIEAAAYSGDETCVRASISF